jgi:GT2 family glycosyltransferase
MKKVLLAMAVHNTEENQRFNSTKKTIESLVSEGEPFNQSIECHLFIIDNGSTCKKTIDYLSKLFHTGGLPNWFGPLTIHRNDKNYGTAAAINKAWRHRQPGQHCIKMDDDVLIHDTFWIQKMYEAIEREPQIGIVGLKRKDCWEHPAHENPDLRSELMMLPHVAGQPWIVAEKVFHVMGTCQMYSSALLDQIGYLYQPSLYGYDDVLSAHRCHKAGMWSVFLPGIEIDHIDPGNTPYQKWKEDHAATVTNEVIRIAAQYRSGERSIYFNPFQ